MLEQSDIAHYLLSLGVVKPRSVVEEDLTIVDASRRNRVFVASTRDGPAYVVKQAGLRSAASLAHEATVLRALAQFPEMAGRVPAIVHHDPEAAMLVLVTPAVGREWTLQHRRGRFPRRPAQALARALAALHGIPADSFEDGSGHLWAFRLSEPPFELLLDLSSGAQELVARVQGSASLCARLLEVRHAPGAKAVVHGDVRWDNCLTLAPPDGRRSARVLLIDWEFAGRGAVAWDVGTVLAEYLAAWAASVPIVDPHEPGRLLARARMPLRRMRPAAQAFWFAYRRASRCAPPTRAVMEFAGVRLLQTAVEIAQRTARPTTQALLPAQLAQNLLMAPDDAARDLLGLGES